MKIRTKAPTAVAGGEVPVVMPDLALDGMAMVIAQRGGAREILTTPEEPRTRAFLKQVL
ncbi:hypothetical protein ACLRGI_07490 [Paenarthrobacter nitroguajacolicus]|uniref:hypothetical protein n=1 Tax=Paenarthrobacter nitroguajacolicus TaxID=211146 RepID=UPI003AE45EF0